MAPITLLDADELLTRVAAASALGLDPAKPAVLIHLGAGHNRDIVSLIDQIVEILQRTPQLQICIAEWVNGSAAAELLAERDASARLPAQSALPRI